jgi:hypothetical protein
VLASHGGDQKVKLGQHPSGQAKLTKQFGELGGALLVRRPQAQNGQGGSERHFIPFGPLPAWPGR